MAAVESEVGSLREENARLKNRVALLEDANAELHEKLHDTEQKYEAKLRDLEQKYDVVKERNTEIKTKTRLAGEMIIAIRDEDLDAETMQKMIDAAAAAKAVATEYPEGQAAVADALDPPEPPIVEGKPRPNAKLRQRIKEAGGVATYEVEPELKIDKSQRLDRSDAVD